MKLVDITEGRDAPLYHLAGINKIIPLCNDNVLLAEFEHDFYSS